MNAEMVIGRVIHRFSWRPEADQAFLKSRLIRRNNHDPEPLRRLFFALELFSRYHHAFQVVVLILARLIDKIFQFFFFPFLLPSRFAVAFV